MIEQRSDEWYAQRLGKVTASRVADVTARIKTGWGASRANYMAELLVERLTGAAHRGYVSPEMQWGTDHEGEARATYELLRDCDVVLAEFVGHPTITMAGASPDGYVGDDGLVEFKCPNTATHIETLLSDAIPGKYYGQMQFQMACTGRKWCDWVSYDPRLPASMQLFVKRMHRDDGYIGEIEGHITDFLFELDAKVSALRQKYEAARAA